MNTRHLSLMVAALMVLSCAATNGDDSGAAAGNANAGAHGGENGSSGGFNAGMGGTTAPPPAVAQLFGKVFAPEGTIPISGALVYLSATAPDPIPDGVYCDKCVELDFDTPYVFSKADGSFELPSHLTGSLQLVVQKGQFRRVRTLSIVTGDQTAPVEMTTLPGRMNKQAGDDIPKMAVITATSAGDDHIEVSLAKLGLADILPGAFGGVDKTTAGFDFIENSLQDPWAPQEFVRQWDRISKYHIVFVPCSISKCSDYTPDEAMVQDNLRKYVRAGGKLYVTDYAYEYLRRPWSGFVDWEGLDGETGSACLYASHDAQATVDDDGLKDWLAAQGINDFELLGNWTHMTKVSEATALDLDGNTVTQTPKIWVSGDQSPATVSFQDQCGRVMLSTYHTEGAPSEPALLPQELALLYVLLEVGVCIEPPKPR